MRGDLQMSPGKMAAQAGHAFLDAYTNCARDHPEIAAEYNTDCHGTKVVLHARNEDELRRLHEHITLAEIPCALIIDSGHIMPPYFDGSPIVTALGIGPATRSQIHQFTKKYQLLK